MTLPVAGMKGCGPLGWAGRLAYAVDADRTAGGDMRKPSAAASDDRAHITYETRAKTLTLSVQINNQPIFPQLPLPLPFPTLSCTRDNLCSCEVLERCQSISAKTLTLSVQAQPALECKEWSRSDRVHSTGPLAVPAPVGCGWGTGAGGRVVDMAGVWGTRLIRLRREALAPSGMARDSWPRCTAAQRVIDIHALMTTARGL